jgi:hypothetical protein
MGISDSAEEPELFIYFIHFVRNDIECPNTSFSYKVLPEVFNLLEIWTLLFYTRTIALSCFHVLYSTKDVQQTISNSLILWNLKLSLFLRGCSTSFLHGLPFSYSIHSCVLPLRNEQFGGILPHFFSLQFNYEIFKHSVSAARRTPSLCLKIMWLILCRYTRKRKLDLDQEAYLCFMESSESTIISAYGIKWRVFIMDTKMCFQWGRNWNFMCHVYERQSSDG